MVSMEHVRWSGLCATEALILAVLIALAILSLPLVAFMLAYEALFVILFGWRCTH